MVGQNAALTSQNAFERLSQKIDSLDPFAWHSNSILTFNHSHGMYMASEWHNNSKSGKKFELFHSKDVVKTATYFFLLKPDDEIRSQKKNIHI